MRKQIDQVCRFMLKHGFGDELLCTEFHDERRIFNEIATRAEDLKRRLTYDDTLLEDRVKLIAEEFSELMKAISERDETEVKDAIIDLLYVIIGFGVLIPGFDIEKAFEDVHQHNMQKPVDGKFKPKEEGDTKPDLECQRKRLNCALDGALARARKASQTAVFKFAYGGQHGPECFAVHGFVIPIGTKISKLLTSRTDFELNILVEDADSVRKVFEQRLLTKFEDFECCDHAHIYLVRLKTSEDVKAMCCYYGGHQHFHTYCGEVLEPSQIKCVLTEIFEQTQIHCALTEVPK